MYQILINETKTEIIQQADVKMKGAFTANILTNLNATLTDNVKERVPGIRTEGKLWRVEGGSEMRRKVGCTTSEDAASKSKRTKGDRAGRIGSEPGCISE